MGPAIIVFAHGSSVESANESVRRVAESFAVAGRFELVETAFLELASPNLKEAVDRLAVRGAKRIIVAPYFLTLGIHLQRDLPRMVSEAAEAHPGLPIVVTPPLDGHPAMIDILLERVRAAMETIAPTANAAA